MFPNQDCPDDTKNGRPAFATALTLPCTAASSGPEYVVAEKTKGSPHRREVVRIINDSERKPLQWHDHNFYQV